MALHRDGRIVDAGVHDADTAVVQFRPDGTLDPHFGQGGTFVSDIGSFDGAAAVAVQRNDKIVTAGFAGLASGADDTALLRFR